MILFQWGTTLYINLTPVCLKFGICFKHHPLNACFHQSVYLNIWGEVFSQPRWGDPSWIRIECCLLYTLAPWIDLTPLNSPPTPCAVQAHTHTHTVPRWEVEDPSPLQVLIWKHLTAWLTLIRSDQRNYLKGDRPLGTYINKPATPDYYWIQYLCVWQYLC